MNLLGFQVAERPVSHDPRLVARESLAFVWLPLVGGLLIFAPLLEGGTTHLAVVVIRLAILALLSVLVVRILLEQSLPGLSLPIVWPLGAFLGLAGVSTLFSAYLHPSLQWFLVLVSYAGLLCFLVCSLRTWNHIWWLLAILAGMAVFQACLAVLQFHWLLAERPRGTFFNPNFLAGYLAGVFVVILSLLAHARVGWSGSWALGVGLSRGAGPGLSSGMFWKGGRLAPGKAPLVAGGVALALMLWAIGCTGSRGGMLALAVGSAVVCATRYGRRGLLAAFVLLLVVFATPNPFRERLQMEHQANPMTYARWEMWQSSLQMMLDHPLGVGLGQYQYVYPSYAFPAEGQIARYGRLAKTPHNEYVQMGAELGFLALVIFVWGSVILVRDVRALFRRRLRRWERGALVGVSAGVTALLTQAAVDSSLHQPALALILTTYVGILMAARANRPADAAGRRLSLRPLLVLCGVSFLILGILATVFVKNALAWSSYEAGSRANREAEFPRAIAAFRHAVLLDGRKSLYHSALAAAHFRSFERTNDYDVPEMVIDELRTAISLNPRDGRLHGLLGYTYAYLASTPGYLAAKQRSRSDLLHRGLAAYRQAIKLEPVSPFHRLALGRLHLALGNRRKAEAAVTEAVRLEPNFLKGRTWLAGLYAQSPRAEDQKLALREYEEILDRRTRYNTRYKDAYAELLLQVDVEQLEHAVKSTAH